MSFPFPLSPFAFAALSLLASAVHPSAQCEILTLAGPPSEPYGSHYGFSVSLSGDRIAIGDYAGGDPSTGTVEVFDAICHQSTLRV